MNDLDVLIVGAGLAGLSCAVELQKQGKSVKLLESSDAAGGRVRTDAVDGYRLDRGFQVFLTAYPEARRILNYDALALRNFKSGALIRYEGGFCRVSDVMRHPGDLPGNLFSRAASLSDKLKIASLRHEVGRSSIQEIAQSPNITTHQRLLDFGFSERIIHSFFRPFFGGVFLEPELKTSRRMFDFVFKMFAEGYVSIPARGMGEISRQLVENLGESQIELGCTVTSFSNDSVTTADGREIKAKNVVIAVDENSAADLSGYRPEKSCGVMCFYFAADRSPIDEPILVLNGDESGPINNLCVPSDVSDQYAPPDKALVSVTVLGNGQSDELQNQVIEQARDWFGDQVSGWELLKTYSIDQALPCQRVQRLQEVSKPILRDGVLYCGDYLSFASIQGAFETGRKVAEYILKK